MPEEKSNTQRSTVNKIYMIDTETTGLNVDEGDRIIEIGAVEYEGMQPTGRTYRTLVNPEDRQIQAGAFSVHGINQDHVKNSPTFSQVANEFLDFINDGDLVIYNASFDMGFLNAELARANMAEIANNVIDALEIARKKYPRSKNTLDALAKRLKVDTSARTLHGALIDADILGRVYCKLIQQDELIIEQEQKGIALETTGKIKRRPLLRASNTQGTHLTRAETSYTLFSSALSPKKLVSLAVEEGYDSVALTDKYTIAGAMSFAEECKKNQIKGIVGVSLDIAKHTGKTLVFYAANKAGWKNIQKLITLRNVENKGEGLTSSQLRQYSEGIVAVAGETNGIITEIYKSEGYEAVSKVVAFFKAVYPNNFALEISRNRSVNDDTMEAVITKLAEDHELPILASVICRAPTGQEELVEVLKAIGGGGQYQPEFSDGEDLPQKKNYKSLFVDIPEAVDNCGWLANRCDFLPKGEDPMLPRFDTGLDETEAEALERLARKGLNQHLKNVDSAKHPEYLKRYDYEMSLINGQGFAGYFLIVADFIDWANKQGIPVGPGRGSGAGSIVAWSLGITKLDPIDMRLLFERFINPERVSLPDFDIDFCERRREEVIRYVRQKYGHNRVVAIGAYTTFQSRMGIKDVGRILGQSHGLMHKISQALPDKGEITSEIMAQEEIQSLLSTAESKEALRLGASLYGLIRNKTRHPAGIVIADRPVDEIMALELDPNDQEQSVTQYDMKPVEKAGLVKFDFLGLNTLTIIERARKNLMEMGVNIDPYSVSLDDEKTLKALSQGRTMGVFQLESGGITRVCREVKVDNFEDIVAIVALYRPGPMEFIPLYARRKKGLEPFGTPHPLLDDVTRTTYGILVYQEQVMQAAQVLAGYSLGEADLLRRAMGKKIQSEMDAQREVFIKGCKETNGIEKDKANALFELIDKFAGYGFNRSHAAAYGLLSYITAWLANNYPAAYFAAAMDGFADDSEKIMRLAQEARKRNIKLLPPVIDGKAEHFLPIDEKTIRWSLTAIKGMGDTAVKNLIRQFKDKPPESIKEIFEKSGEKLNRNQAITLAVSGALDQMGEGSRGELIVKMRTQYDGMASEAKSKRAGQIGLFEDDQSSNELDSKYEIPDEKEILELERAALGITLTAHPIDSYEAWMDAESITSPSNADVLLEHMPVRVAAQIDEVKNSKRGSWMTVRISDSQTALETGCDEGLENAHLLQKGAVIVMQISGYIKAGERRLRIDAIEDVLGEENKGEIAQTLIIEADDDFNRDELRKVIAETKEGKGRLRILQYKNRTTTPPIVEITPEFIAMVEGVRGVKNAQIA